MDIIDKITENHLTIEFLTSCPEFKKSEIIEPTDIQLKVSLHFEKVKCETIRNNICRCDDCLFLLDIIDKQQRDIIKSIRKIIIRNCN